MRLCTVCCNPPPSISQIQDASKKKFSKCEHIDVDWGVSGPEGDNDIYQTPTPLTEATQSRSISPVVILKKCESSSYVDGELAGLCEVIARFLCLLTAICCLCVEHRPGTRSPEVTLEVCL